MSIEAFTDKNHRPTDNEIYEVIGTMLPVWQSFVKFIREDYSTHEEFKFQYGKKYGWALRFQVNGKLLTSLYPTQNGVTVQINLSPNAVENAVRMKLSKNVREAIGRATPYPEGRWLFIHVESANDIKDVKRLLVLRSEMLNQVKTNSKNKDGKSKSTGKQL